MTRRANFKQTGVKGINEGYGMKLYTLGSTSFFARSFHSPNQGVGDVAANHEQAAAVIQQWWKQIQLKQTAAESTHYLSQVVSLRKAQNESFSKLEQCVRDERTIKLTHNLLMHLEQAKDLVLPSRKHLPKLPRLEQIFLSAYLIVTNPPPDIDEALLAQAEKMLQCFERLCSFLCKAYLESTTIPASPIAQKTPFADLALASLEKAQYERMKQDLYFMKDGKEYLEAFHQTQLDYYKTFSQWEFEDRHKLVQMLINHYMQLETERFSILNNPDPRLLELNEGYEAEQAILQKRISNLLGEEGLELLKHSLSELGDRLEANKWITTPKEVLVHEFALNPELSFSPSACDFHSRENIDDAIVALSQEPPNIELILSVFEELGNQMALLTPHNSVRVAALRQEFSRQTIKKLIEDEGLFQGLYHVIYSLINQIKGLESEEHVTETISFLEDLNATIDEIGVSGDQLKQALEYIYHKCSQIHFESSYFYMKQARDISARNSVPFEQQAFQERLAGKQFNLSVVLNFIDKIIHSPKEYGLDTVILCSQHLPNYLAQKILIVFLQQQDQSALQSVPETFYLDRRRLLSWRSHYQNIFYTAVAMSYFEIICAKYKIKPSIDELEQQKKILLGMLETAIITTPKEIVEQLLFGLNQVLKKQGKVFLPGEEQTLKTLIEEVCLGNHPVAKLINKRLGDELSVYLFKGALPDSSTAPIKWCGLRKELSQLGQEILPALRLHVKVHGAFYHQQAEIRLWKPLFEILRETQVTELPLLLLSEEESIKETQASFHKLAFVLCGLALMQQAVIYSDVYRFDIRMKNSMLKELAGNFKLIEMVKDPQVSKEKIEERLIQLMRDINKEEPIIEEHEMKRMLKWAKNEQSPGVKAFLDELLIQFKQMMLEENSLPLDPKHLMAEFREVVSEIGDKIKKITDNIKKNNRVDDVNPVAQAIPQLHSGKTM